MMYGQRNFGLDLFRFCAIFLVLLSHTRHLFSWIQTDSWNWWYLSVGGYLGVELFFVLSGFLIGRILISKVLFRKTNLWRALGTFWVRRWLRTLPLYYLVLFLTYIAASYLSGAENASWLHVVFLQNFSDSALGFLPVSWSLSVEEWFYLTVPLLLLMVVHNRSQQAIFYGIVGGIVIIFTVRLLAVFFHADLSWGEVRKSIFLRFDSLLVGVLWAFLSIHCKAIYQTLSGFPAMLLGSFLLGGLISYYFLLQDAGLNQGFFAKTGFFVVTSLVLLPLLGFAQLHIHGQSRVITLGSQFSYGIYLIHFQFLPYFVSLSHGSKNILLSIVYLCIYLAVVVWLAFLLYRYFEFPIMQWRENISPDN
ncbi:acyltransferase family protein [Rhabdochromatium marinum]|uniref:acyltransferase family protein n=1 Tax=Rhabdochromatium marinum TaxID=48729 RepID=UPI00190493E0|nr:acyltransferase [Rhabdochromatium marinum]MBK1647789.1 hypothetical protein [Rhabdochromatium marinum]